MKTNEIIESAVQMAEGVKNNELATALEKVAKELEGDTLKVVVLGDFKAGKSALINTLFLKDNLLPVDYLEATAVPTHLTNGPKRMQTWLRSESGEETRQDEWSDFDQEKVKSIVTADTEQKRAEIAQKYSRVSISMPDILPPGITLVDTPGLNTPNLRIQVGTLQEARTAHAILYVVRGKQLSNRELTLIADMAGLQRPSLPIHVVLTEDDTHEAGQMKVLCDTIKAQLESANIEDCGVSVFTFGKGETLNIDVNEWDPFPDTDDVPTSSTSDGSIANELDAFFNGPVRQGRSIRQVRDLRPLLERLQVAMQAHLELAGKDETNVAALEDELRQKQQLYISTLKNMLRDIDDAKDETDATIHHDLNAMLNNYETELNRCETLQDVRHQLDVIQRTFPDDINNVIRCASSQLRRAIESICSTYNQTLEQSMALRSDASLELKNMFLKIVSKTPDVVIWLIDLLLMGPVIPGGPLWDVVLSWLLGNFPLIRQLMPTALVGKLAANYAVKELENHIADLKVKVSKVLQDNFETMSKNLLSRANSEGVFAELEQAIKHTRSRRISEAEKTQLQEWIATCKRWMECLAAQ